MKTINITFPDKFSKNPMNAETFKEGGYAIFFEILLNQGINNKFPNGQIPISKGKILARIQTKLDELKPQDGSDCGSLLTVEEAEYDLIKSVFLDESTTFSVAQHQLVAVLSNAVEDAAKSCDSPCKLVS